MTAASLALDPDRLLPPEPGVRRVARELYAGVAGDPIVSPHGHVEARLLADDEPFGDPAALFITPDHYVTRLLHAHGVGLDRLGVGGEADPREVWRLFCAHWGVFAGTPVRLWLAAQFAEVFGVDVVPSAETADELFDELQRRLQRPEYRPRALFERFGIEVLATTDDPADDLAAHRRLRDDETFAGRVVPTFRPDAYLSPDAPGWAEALQRLAERAGVDVGTHAGLLAALRVRRAAFAELGGTSTDTSVPDAWAVPLPAAEAERIHAAGLAGTVGAEDARAYRRDLLYRLAEMSAEDGLVMQLHPGVVRNHHEPTLRRFGRDTGHDLPEPMTFVRPLQRMLNDFGLAERFRLVLFTIDETTMSRELAPLAGFYPSVFVGAPWWFLDTPSAISRFRRAVTDSAGFGKTSGFIDDTRAFCSIPARHDLARRVDAGFLAELVAGGALGFDEAYAIAKDLAGPLPRRVFRL